LTVRITVSADYDATPDAVWAVLEPIESHVEWMADAEVIRFRGSQTRGTGTTFTLDPLDDGRRTRFTWQEELRFPWWVGGPLGERVGGQQLMRRIWAGNLRRLRSLVERSP